MDITPNLDLFTAVITWHHAEFTGPWFSPDGKTLFLSVQHPGEQTTDLKNPTSLWPFDKDNIPKPSVVAITGDLIEKMNNLHMIEKP